MSKRPSAKSDQKLDRELIRDLAELLTETGLSEIEIEKADLRIRVARNFVQGAPAPLAATVAAADMNVALEAARMLLWRAAASAQVTPSGFPDPLLAAQAKLIASENAVKVTNDALQLHGAAGYSRNLPLERMVRDARMFTIGGGTGQMLRNLIAGRILDMKVPQTRDGYSRLAERHNG